MKGTEPRPIIGYLIVLLIIAIVAMNQELLVFLPRGVKIIGVVFIGFISYSVIKTELARQDTRK